MMTGEALSENRYLAAARSLYLDLVTAEVVEAFGAAGIRSILLRGPAVGRWLYEHESSRPYMDIDLLVEERRSGSAGSCLGTLGFAEVGVEGVLPGDRPTHAHPWSRGDGACVDLHTTILGVLIPGDEAWAILATGTDTITVAGWEVEVLGQPARALMLALHAGHHGARVSAPLQDLALALEKLPFSIWESAASLAARLEATDLFAAGLRLLPAGETVGRRLSLPAGAPVYVVLRATTPPPMALGFEWLSQTPGWRGKASLVARKVVPSRRFMRAWSPLARRGRIGLALAYLWRPIWLALHAGPAFFAWRRARKASG
jgi:hypothetical protein